MTANQKVGPTIRSGNADEGQSVEQGVALPNRMVVILYQDDLAAEAGMSRSYLVQIETDTSFNVWLEYAGAANAPMGAAEITAE